MMQRLHPCLLLCLLILALAPSTRAVMSDYEPQPAVVNDPDYAAGLAAFERADWQGVIDNMAKVVVRRPWRDNAYSLMGFASRKLGNYRRALEYYHKALELNPHHRGALEYLGEAYLDMGCIALANDTLARLETACKRIADNPPTGGQKVGCEEWETLKTAIDAFGNRTKQICMLE